MVDAVLGPVSVPAVVPGARGAAGARGEPATSAVAGGVRVLRDLVYAEPTGFRPLALDLHLPPTAATGAHRGDPAPLVLFVHGGGWRSGSRREFGPDVRDAFARIAAAGFAVASVDYRLSGEAVFPAQVDDVAAALAWLRVRADAFGIDGARVVAWGESAGATIASLVALRADASVRGVVHWYGPTNLIEHARLLGRTNDPDCAEARWLGATAGERPDLAAGASPALVLTAGAAARAGAPTGDAYGGVAVPPPFLVVNGTSDDAVPHAQAVEFADALAAAGGEVELVLVDGARHRFEGDVDREALFEHAVGFARRAVSAVRE
ncbi:alpha/beta hydrolase fold domain-containing protein [Agromyces sp. CFH 90414]|uniref:Alpha/beta hydrolase fold domain-containing protein n=2 Tax=Agromyces agglutinans TaxID=2662258 RepID=A0A6I2F3E7_9MICO|nr:alpha/beta hydrolase fold domain-containing protein [Agromyces agglutinans]